MTALLLALAVMVGGPSLDPRPAQNPSAAAGAPQRAPASHRPLPGGGAHLPRGKAVTGTASWGDGWAGVVTRYRRGTRIRVCGPLACWSGRSVGYGPKASTGRIADLSRAVFARICGDPSIGLCRVRLEVYPS